MEVCVCWGGCFSDSVIILFSPSFSWRYDKKKSFWFYILEDTWEDFVLFILGSEE